MVYCRTEGQLGVKRQGGDTDRVTLWGEKSIKTEGQSSEAALKSRWPSWAPVPNKPTVSVHVKQQSTNRDREMLRGRQGGVKTRRRGGGMGREI